MTDDTSSNSRRKAWREPPVIEETAPASPAPAEAAETHANAVSEEAPVVEAAASTETPPASAAEANPEDAPALSEPAPVPQQEPPAASQPAPSAHAPLSGYLGAGLIGAAVAAAVFWFLPAKGPNLDDINAHLATLEQKAGDLDAATKNAAGLAQAAKDESAKALAAPKEVVQQAAPLDLRPMADRIAKLETAVATPQPGAAQGNAAATAVVAQALTQAIADGRGFSTELTALQGLGADPAEIAKLKPYADRGAPTMGDLSEQFAGLTSQILDAGNGINPDDSFLDRIKKTAANLVQIRPVGATSGDDPAALVSRIEAALQRGNAEAALEAYNKLPDAAKAPAQAWSELLKAHAESDQAGRAILASAISALGQSKQQ